MAARPRRLPPVPRFVRAVARLVGLPVSAVRSYWAQESRSIRNGSLALLLGLGATLIAGVVLAASEERLEGVPGLLALIPAAIGMRGAIFGALGSRLATGILTGQFERTLARRSYLGRQVEAATILSISSAGQAGVIAWLASAALGLPTVALLELVAVSLIGGVLSSAVLFVVVVAMARRSEALGFSMDDVGAPVITATGDLVTLPSLLVATLVLEVPVAAAAVGGVGLLGGLVAAVQGIRRRDAVIRGVVRESLVVLTVAVTVDVAAGVVVEARASRQFAAAALLLLIPPFIANCGSLGGMLASRLASKLHVGQLEPRLVPGRLAALDFSLIGLLALLAFTGVGAAGWLAALLVPGVAPLSLGATLAVTVIAGMLAVPVLALTSYVVAATSFRFGFDPDNHGIPIVTAAMDLTGILCLVAAITLLQVGT